MAKKTAPVFDMIAIGESLRDVFYMIHEATVQCQLNTDDCLLCLRYADKIPVERIVKVPAAGNSANAAVCMSRLGLASALVTWIGDDYGGRHIFEHLTHERVDTTFVMRDKHKATSESTILDFHGEKTQLVHFEPRDYVLPKLPSTRSIYYSAMGLDHDAFDRKLLAWLHAHPDVLFFFQPGTTHINEGLTPELTKLTARSDLFILNREEAASLVHDGEQVKPRLMAFHRMGAKRVIITDGKNGATGFDGKETWFMPAYPNNPKETTGAGDSFAATVAAMLLKHKTFPEAMHAGSAMASSVIEHIGPQGGLLKTKDLNARLKTNLRIKPKRI